MQDPGTFQNIGFTIPLSWSQYFWPCAIASQLQCRGDFTWSLPGASPPSHRPFRPPNVSALILVIHLLLPKPAGCTSAFSVLCRGCQVPIRLTSASPPVRPAVGTEGLCTGLGSTSQARGSKSWPLVGAAGGPVLGGVYKGQSPHRGLPLWEGACYPLSAVCPRPRAPAFWWASLVFS